MFQDVIFLPDNVNFVLYYLKIVLEVKAWERMS